MSQLTNHRSAPVAEAPEPRPWTLIVNEQVMPFVREHLPGHSGKSVKSRFSRRDGSGMSYSLGIFFRRLALISFLETIIATYLVHRAEVAAVMASANLATVLVLLIGFFVTIVLCAASVAFSNN